MTDKKPDPFDLAAGVPQIEGELRPKPKAADRISKRVLVAAFACVAVLVAIFFVSLDQIDSKPSRPSDEKKPVQEDAKDVGKAPEELTGKMGLNASATPGAAATDKAPPSLAQSADKLLEPFRASTTKADEKNPASVPNGTVPAMTGLIPKEPTAGGQAPLTPEQQAAFQALQERNNRLRQAKVNGLVAKPFDDGTGPSKATPTALDAVKGLVEQAAKGQGAGFAPEQKRTSADTEQDEKLDFLKTATKDGNGYHQHVPVPAVSKNEVKMGSFIPMTLQQGINSDLPGQVTARTTEGVYDTIEGCRLLIPPLTTAVGKYDSKIALGQNRILVVWNALIFPDGSELNLAGMQGYDTSGMAGMESDTDNHYLRLFGVGLGMSLVSATAQIAVPSQPQAATGTAAAPNYTQSVSAALAQQFGQLGGQMMGKYAAVQPTLRNYFGEQFAIMVPRTIVFQKVWANRCNRAPGRVAAR